VSFERDFLAFMPFTLTYQAYSGISTDGYGARTYSTGTKSVRCRIEPHRQIVKDVQSREVTTSFRISTAPYSTVSSTDTVTITALDKITLPTGFLVAGSCSPQIISAYLCQDEAGLHHNEVVI
jgi:hypothetical protein